MGLELFIMAMWVMVLAVSAFLVLAVAPLEVAMKESPRIVISAIQAVIAIAAVTLLAFGLSRLKRAYANRKLYRT
ncbi:hypothetical protein [Nitrososphaera viennensis]|uniref:Uncharacterized protein n=2 Tax=Nitrososphaera viennensis TaxID=1034015 RepID=A0A060HJ71_9ARCH|nr:hypothetical protein [Nitrososphaera viennensis]AIC15573.1 hypothetical protein NVIE_013360 [Nitrososphaera viennensis EN76]UVS70449.1 hypothetical protein NWT39_06605 [Nitrososphaera viennensis]